MTEQELIKKYGAYAGSRIYREIRKRGGTATVNGPDSDEVKTLGGAVTGPAAPKPEPQSWDSGALQELSDQQAYDRGLLGEDRDQWRALYEGGGQQVADAGGRANESSAQWLQWLNGQHTGLGELEMPDYRGGYTSAEGFASADPMSIEGQRDAMGKYKGLTDPRITDAERTMMEVTRRKQERDQRASRTAALSGMRSRGFASGGDEIAALMGSQQETGQRRMLEDLGTRGAAVGRSMDALKGYADTAGQMRDASFGESQKRGAAMDATSQFNITQRQDFDTWLAETQQNELQNRSDRDARLFDKGQGVIGDNYVRDVAPAAFQLDAFGRNPGGGGGGGTSTQGFIDLVKARYGAEQAEKAAKAVKPDEGWLPDDVPIIGKWI